MFADNIESSNNGKIGIDFTVKEKNEKWNQKYVCRPDAQFIRKLEVNGNIQNTLNDQLLWNLET